MMKNLCNRLFGRDQRYRPKIEVYRALNGEWYSRFRAHNGEIVLGPDPYLGGRASAIRTAESLAKQLDVEVKIIEPQPNMET